MSQEKQADGWRGNNNVRWNSTKQTDTALSSALDSPHASLNQGLGQNGKRARAEPQLSGTHRLVGYRGGVIAAAAR